MDPHVAGKLFAQIARIPAGPDTAIVAELSDRERELLSLLARGLTNADIAARLHLSEGTVRNYISFEHLHTPLSTVNTYPVAGLETHRGIAAADDSRYPQLACDDGGVAQRRTEIGDDGGQSWEERSPANVGQRGDQYLTRL